MTTFMSEKQIQAERRAEDNFTQVHLETLLNPPTIPTDERLCGICDQPLGDHPYLFHETCFNGLNLCTDCGNRTGRKGEFDVVQKRQRSLCQKCAQKRIPQTPVRPPTLSPHNPLLIYWNQLGRAENDLIKLRADEPVSALIGMERLYADAESACDREQFDIMAKLLRRFNWQKQQFPAARKLAHYSYQGREDEEQAFILEGWALAQYELACNLFDAAQYPDCQSILTELEGLALYELAEADRLRSLDHAILSLSLKLDFQTRERRRIEQAEAEIEAKAARNRQARLAFKNKQTVAPVPVPMKQALIFIHEEPCLLCGTLSPRRLCRPCYKGLPKCPICNNQPIHVDRKGVQYDQCYQCYRATIIAPETSKPVTQKTQDPQKAKKEADRRARQLARSINPNRLPSSKK